MWPNVCTRGVNSLFEQCQNIHILSYGGASLKCRPSPTKIDLFCNASWSKSSDCCTVGEGGGLISSAPGLFPCLSYSTLYFTVTKKCSNWVKFCVLCTVLVCSVHWSVWFLLYIVPGLVSILQRRSSVLCEVWFSIVPVWQKTSRLSSLRGWLESPVTTRMVRTRIRMRITTEQLHNLILFKIQNGTYFSLFAPLSQIWSLFPSVKTRLSTRKPTKTKKDYSANLFYLSILEQLPILSMKLLASQKRLKHFLSASS